jgi:hypothetical protein
MKKHINIETAEQISRDFLCSKKFLYYAREEANKFHMYKQRMTPDKPLSIKIISNCMDALGYEVFFK